MMKVLVIAPYLAPVYGGTSKAILELAQSLGQQGVMVDIISSNADGVGKLSSPVGQWIQESHYRIGYFSCWHHNDLILSPSLITWLIQHVNEYDVVHINTIFSPLLSFVYLICQWSRVPYLMTPHGMLDKWALAYKPRKKELFLKLFDLPALNRASAIQVLTTSESENLMDLRVTAPTLLVPNGIHRQDFAVIPSPVLFQQNFPATQGKKIILFLGRIDPKKGLDLLAPAFAKALAIYPDVHLVVAGPDNIGFMPKVVDYFEGAGCMAAVTFTGMLTGQLKYSALAAASIYVSPSYSEGLSMSILEGMAMGLPCIITTGCNFPEAGTARSALVVDINADEIANGLIECLNNPHQSKLLGERARQFVFENYTWDRVASNLSQAYQDIVDRQATASPVHPKQSPP
jgi:glycosyltransferase involved in cell wall biosynthesis